MQNVLEDSYWGMEGGGGMGGEQNPIRVQKVSCGAGPEEVEIQRRRSETVVD